jgi:amidase
MSTWQELVAEKKRRQTASIPKEWFITLPADDVLDVTDVPSNCGLLSARELEITEVSEIAVLLNKLATGEWSSVEVTTAFCKRAIVAHQLVCPSSSPLSGGSLITLTCCPDKLSHRDIR